MDVVVVIPEDYFGYVMGDLTRHRGPLQENETWNNGASIIHALVPLSEMFGFCSMTSGYGTCQK